jgi:hypothetical protein
MKSIKLGDSYITKIQSSNLLNKSFNIELTSLEKKDKTYIFDISIDELEEFINRLKNYKSENNDSII